MGSIGEVVLLLITAGGIALMLGLRALGARIIGVGLVLALAAPLLCSFSFGQLPDGLMHVGLALGGLSVTVIAAFRFFARRARLNRFLGEPKSSLKKRVEED